MNHGLAYFPGINQIVSAHFCLTNGISPSIAILEIAPQPDLTSLVGTLQFMDGTNTIEFDECAIDTTSFEYDDRGLIWKLVVRDRRWKWGKFGGGGIISGTYNVKNDNGEYLEVHTEEGTTDNKMTAQDFIHSCLDAMGETDYDLSGVPTDEFPTIDFDAVLPAEAMAQVCDDLGLLIVLGLDKKVHFYDIGDGQELPITNAVLENSQTLDTKIVPRRVSIVTAPCKFDAAFELEAVGLNNDESHTVRVIDELDYKPAGGWESDTIEFDNVGKEFGEEAQKLAQESIYRMYRVKVPTMIPGYTAGSHADDKQSEVSDLWKIKLEDTTVETYIDDEGNLKPFKAYIVGTFINPEDWNLRNTIGGTDDIKDAKDQSKTVIGWTLDKETRIVTFNTPMYMNLADNSGGDVTIKPGSLTLGPAFLYLYTACTILDELFLAPVRYKYDFDTGGYDSTAERVEVAEDIVPSWYPNYEVEFESAGGTSSAEKVVFKLEGTIDDLGELQEQFQKKYDTVLKEYESQFPQTVRYGGILAIDLDGAIHNVSWEVGATGCMTTACRGTEQFSKTASRGQRRDIETSKYHQEVIMRDRRIRTRNRIKGKGR